MTNTVTQSTHPETAASTDHSFDVLRTVAERLPEALGLVDGSTVDDRRSARAVLNQVPPEAMQIALEIGDGLPSSVWNPAPVASYLAERERLAEVVAVLRRLDLVETLIRRHLVLAGEPAAQAVLDLRVHLKRRVLRHGGLVVEDDVQRLEEALPHVGLRPAKRVKKEEPTPPAK